MQDSLRPDKADLATGILGGSSLLCSTLLLLSWPTLRSLLHALGFWAVALWLCVLAIIVALGLRLTFKGRPTLAENAVPVAGAILLLVGLLGLRAWAAWINSDAYLAERFTEHRAACEQLVSMMREDNAKLGLTKVTISDGSGVMFWVADQPIAQERRTTYETLGKGPGVQAVWWLGEIVPGQVALILDSFRLATTEWSRGIVWSPKIMPRVQHGWPYRTYSPIADGWYVYLEEW